MQEIWALANEMSPYLLLGFLIAGVMHVFVPGSVYSRYLSGDSFRSVVYAAMFGVPLPLCSCGVIPTAMSLRKEGASQGATVSFLIATPQTGVDSIIATYSLLGLPFALVRPVAAFVTAMFGGQLVNAFGKKDGRAYGAVKAADSDSYAGMSLGAKVAAALRYAFVDMMQDIGKWLVVGLVVAGLITVFVPDDFFCAVSDMPVVCMLIVLAIAIPMYVCATGSIPIAVALMLKGLTPGAALVFLMAGPAASAASILVINKVLGRRTMILYLASIVLGAMAFGLGIDYLLPREWFAPAMAVTKSCCMGEHVSVFKVLCTVLLACLLLNALVQHLRRRSILRAAAAEAVGETVSDGSCAEDVRVVHVKGMSCNHCVRNVERAIASLDGVESVEVGLASGEAVVKGDVDIEQVREAVASIGYEVTD